MRGYRGYRELPGNGRNRGREEAAVSCQKMTEIVGEKGLPLAAASYQEIAEIRGGEGLPLAAGGAAPTLQIPASLFVSDPI